MFLDLTDREKSKFSITRLVNAQLAANPRAAAPFEYELADAIRQKAGPSRFGGTPIPDDILFSRTLVTSTGSAGGFLKPTDTPVFHSALIETSWLERVPLLRWGNLTGDLRVPRWTSNVAGVWLTTETSSASPVTPTFDVAPLSPKTCAIVIERSRQHLLQAPQQDDQLLRDLGRSVGFAIAQGCASGSGTNGEPVGALSQIAQTQSGTSLSAAGVAEMIRLVEAAGGGDDLVALCGTTAARIFRTRERASGNGFLLEGDRLLGVRCIVTAAMPADSLIIGAFQHAVLANWGPTIELVVTNIASGAAFRSGLISVRAITSLDFGVLHAPAFARALTIT